MLHSFLVLSMKMLQEDLLWIFFFTQAFEINFLTSQENEIFYEYLLKDNSSDMMLIMLLRF